MMLSRPVQTSCFDTDQNNHDRHYILRISGKMLKQIMRIFGKMAK